MLKPVANCGSRFTNLTINSTNTIFVIIKESINLKEKSKTKQALSTNTTNINKLKQNKLTSSSMSAMSFRDKDEVDKQRSL
jgi:hypothetical protein